MIRDLTTEALERFSSEPPSLLLLLPAAGCHGTAEEGSCSWLSGSWRNGSTAVAALAENSEDLPRMLWRGDCGSASRLWLCEAPAARAKVAAGEASLVEWTGQKWLEYTGPRHSGALLERLLALRTLRPAALRLSEGVRRLERSTTALQARHTPQDLTRLRPARPHSHSRAGVAAQARMARGQPSSEAEHGEVAMLSDQLPLCSLLKSAAYPV